MNNAEPSNSYPACCHDRHGNLALDFISPKRHVEKQRQRYRHDTDDAGQRPICEYDSSLIRLVVKFNSLAMELSNPFVLIIARFDSLGLDGDLRPFNLDNLSRQSNHFGRGHLGKFPLLG